MAITGGNPLAKGFIPGRELLAGVGSAGEVGFLDSDGNLAFDAGFSYDAATDILSLPAGGALDFGTVKLSAASDVLLIASTDENITIDFNTPQANEVLFASTSGVTRWTLSGINRFQIEERVAHIGDPNTFFGFPAADHATVEAGGANFIDCLEDANDILTFNLDGLNMDFLFKWVSGSAFSIDGATGNATFFQALQIGGDLNHDGADVGFRGRAPVTMPSAYNQTYSDTTRTFSAYTPDDESTSYNLGAGECAIADLNALRIAYENLRAFAENTAKLVNQRIDDDQLVGLAQ